jgi:enoyl-CoA hydratase
MIRIEERPPVRILRMEHGKVQALDIELLAALDAAVAGAEADAVGALVVTGCGAAFSAGVDLFRLVNGGAAYVDAFLPVLTTALLRLFSLPLPVVAAINGHAIAGGAMIAWCADLRLMATGAGRIGIPELRVGVPFPAAPLEIARFGCGPSLPRAIATGDTYLPEQALADGLVDEVVPPEGLLDRAVGLATRLAAMPTDAFRLAKAAVRQPTLARIEALRPQMDPAAHRIWASSATQERIRAYLAKTVGRSG